MNKPEPREYYTLEDYYDALDDYLAYEDAKYDEYRDDILLENYEKEQDNDRGNS